MSPYEGMKLQFVGFENMVQRTLGTTKHEVLGE
jgi:hypothetical protein